MSLKSPTDVLKEVFFFFALLLVVLPLVQFGFVCLGIVTLVFHHWIIGTLLVVLGLVGRYVNKNIRI
jgi:hypothetical protein